MKYLVSYYRLTNNRLVGYVKPNDTDSMTLHLATENKYYFHLKTARILLLSFNQFHCVPHGLYQAKISL